MGGAAEEGEGARAGDVELFGVSSWEDEDCCWGCVVETEDGGLDCAEGGFRGAGGGGVGVDEEGMWWAILEGVVGREALAGGAGVGEGRGKSG